MHKLTEKAGVAMEPLLGTLSFSKLRNDLGGLFVFPMVYSQDDCTESIKDSRGSVVFINLLFFILWKANTKFKNLLCTRRLSQEKWQDIITV